MTDHVSEAQKRIAMAERDADDVRRIVATVGDELASTAKYLHSRTYSGTIGSLTYDLAADQVQAMLDRLPPVPLEYRKPRGWAGDVKPANLPLDRYEQQMEQRTACAPWWVDAWSVEHNPATCDVNWYTPAGDRLIRVNIDLTEVHKWVRFWAEEKRDSTGRFLGYAPHWRQNFNRPKISTAFGGGEHGKLSWPHVTLWWPEGTEWTEVIQL